MGNSSSSSSSSSRLSSSYAPPRPPGPRYTQRSNEIHTKRDTKPSRYAVIADNFSSVEEVQSALGDAGLESSNLIVGVDFTKSNQWTGQRSFGGRSLHAIGNEPNPYETALGIVGQTLSPFDEDNLIPCFGFGDSTTHDKQVFSFYPDHRPCAGMDEALARYRAIVPNVRLAGPTSFAPIINAAVDIVEGSGGQYHVLVIIADGQIEGPQERATVDAIVNASYYPLSIVLVGVGDGPWTMMRTFDDKLPARAFDNFQFINFTQIMTSNAPPHRKAAQFALAALMEIPFQYKATVELQLLGTRRGTSPRVNPLPPPPMVLQMDAQAFRSQRPNYAAAQLPQNYAPQLLQNYAHPTVPQAPQMPTSTTSGDYYNMPPSPHAYGQYWGYYPPPAPAPAVTTPRAAADQDGTECPVCLTDKKDMVFNCGHQTCRRCASSLTHCPVCRGAITSRVRLY